ncbi:hypothetical protein JSE7799_03460 [Jannaschia seosinensis]|uniref:Group 4 capsule protein B homolog n=1 Tax=Jannaschia seosinensis TaxID=313367 RepID=A0A0M7BH58_9RHOB|nr:YjbF family lipoprotein [Jannaschia seosinensis]CUH40725.1 hypothetical protein JSE7799_03460 [Jannaschia seosinensis]
MSIWKGACLAAALALAGCSSEPDRGDDSALTVAFRTIAQRISGTGPVDVRETLTAEQIAASRASLILVVVERTDRGLTLAPVAANRGTVQWTDAEGGGLLTRDGILVGTRGFGFDLLTVDAAPLRRALASGSGTDLLRIERVLGGEGVVLREDYLCDLTPVGSEVLDFYGTRYATRILEERCVPVEPGGAEFVNRYWLDQEGVVRRSKQRVTPEIGFLRIDRLAD